MATTNVLSLPAGRALRFLIYVIRIIRLSTLSGQTVDLPRLVAVSIDR